MEMGILIFEVLVIISLIIYNFYIGSTVKKLKVYEYPYIKNLLNILSKKGKIEAKYLAVNNEIIKILGLNYSSIILRSGSTNRVLATNITLNEDINEILNIEKNEEISKLINDDSNYVLLTTEEYPLPYLKNNKDRAKAMMYIKLSKNGEDSGYWIIEDTDIEKIATIKSSKLEIIRNLLVDSLSLLSVQMMLETDAKIELSKRKNLKNLSYLLTDTKLKMDEYSKSTLAFLKIVVDSGFSKNDLDGLEYLIIDSINEYAEDVIIKYDSDLLLIPFISKDKNEIFTNISDLSEKISTSLIIKDEASNEYILLNNKIKSIFNENDVNISNIYLNTIVDKIKEQGIKEYVSSTKFKASLIDIITMQENTNELDDKEKKKIIVSILSELKKYSNSKIIPFKHFIVVDTYLKNTNIMEKVDNMVKACNNENLEKINYL